VTKRKLSAQQCPECAHARELSQSRLRNRLWRLPGPTGGGAVDHDQRAFLRLFSQRSPLTEAFRSTVVGHLEGLQFLSRQELHAHSTADGLAAPVLRPGWVARARFTRSADAINAACETFGRDSGLVDGQDGRWVLRHLLAAVIRLELERRNLAGTPREAAAKQRLLGSKLELGVHLPIGLGSMSHNLRPPSGLDWDNEGAWRDVFLVRGTPPEVPPARPIRNATGDEISRVSQQLELALEALRRLEQEPFDLHELETPLSHASAIVANQLREVREVYFEGSPHSAPGVMGHRLRATQGDSPWRAEPSGWDPSLELECCFRRRVERYINRVVASATAQGLGQHELEPMSGRSPETMDWLVRRFIGESAAKIATSKGLSRVAVEKRVDALRSYLRLPRPVERRGRRDRNLSRPLK
jgi:hypothetical protein